MKLILSILLLGVFAHAAGGGHGEHGSHDIPFETIKNQAINLSILMVVLIYFIRAPLQNLFKSKKESFLEESKKTEEALKKAEQELSEAKSKLKELELHENSSYKKAEEESAAQFQKIIDESKQQAERIVKDTDLIIGAEIEKAKKDLKTKLIVASTAAAEKAISAKSAEITKKSENSFLTELGQVNQ